MGRWAWACLLDGAFLPLLLRRTARRVGLCVVWVGEWVGDGMDKGRRSRGVATQGRWAHLPPHVSWSRPTWCKTAMR